MRKPVRKAQSGIRALLDIVAALRDEPATVAAMAQRFDMVRHQNYAYMRMLLEAGVLRIHGWSRPGGSGNHAIVYGFGREPDAPLPLTKDGRRQIKSRIGQRLQPCVGVIAFVSLWNALKEPSTLGDLMEETGLQRSTIALFVRRARYLQLARLCRWEKHFRIPVAAYALGSGGNEPTRPRPQTSDERNAKDRAREAGRQMTLSIVSALAAKSRRFKPSYQPEAVEA